NGGRGMDVVLNSLTGEFVDASLRLLSSPKDGTGPGGRFVEMGLTDIRSEDEIATSFPGRGYQSFKLTDVAPERIGQMMRRIMEGFAGGVRKPFAVTVRDLRDAKTASRTLQRGDNSGKLVPPVISGVPSWGKGVGTVSTRTL